MNALPSGAAAGAPRAASATASGPRRRVVLFDFDGVIVRGDAFRRFVRAHCRRALWRLLPFVLLAPLFGAMALARGGRRRLIRGAVRWALFGLHAERYRALADSFGRALARDTRNVSRAACQALNAHRHAGDRVLVVTGCEETLARAILAELGFADVAVVGSRLRAGRFGLRLAVHNIRFEKARQLARAGVRPPWDLVYSDSADDLPILAAARSAVLVNPDRATLARVSPRLGRRLATVEWD